MTVENQAVGVDEMKTTRQATVSAFPARALALTILTPILLFALGSNARAEPRGRDHGAVIGARMVAALLEPAVAREVSETDRRMLEQAASACSENGGDTEEEFRSFFEAFVSSPEVRRKYGAAEIHYTIYGDGKVLSDQLLDPSAYAYFPIRLEDYYYMPVQPTRAGDGDEYLDLQFNQSSSNDFSVEWSRIHYDGQSAGGDDLGNPLDAGGKPIPRGTHPDPAGQLLFHPAGNCWEFSDDIRFGAKE